ncbi:MAG TPA: hypothetical protein VGH22_24195 [Candidatus Binatia bacterium]
MAATGIVTRKTYLQKNPEVLENIMKALIEGEHYMMSPDGKAQSIKTIMSRLKLTDVAAAEEGHPEAIKEFDPRPLPSIDGLKNMQRLLANAKSPARGRERGGSRRFDPHAQARRQRFLFSASGTLSRLK